VSASAKHDAKHEAATRPPVFGVGVGPGDPSLLTLRGARVLREASLVVCPKGSADSSSIARAIIAEHMHPACEIIEVVFPMAVASVPPTPPTPAPDTAAEQAAALLAAAARRNETAVFVTLGDALLYSTWGYVLRALRARHPDIQAETVPGVTAMSAAAARFGRALVEKDEPLLVWPAGDPAVIPELLDVSPNIVALKAGRCLGAIVSSARAAGADVVIAERLGMEGERVIACDDAAEQATATPDTGYFTTVIMHRDPSWSLHLDSHPHPHPRSHQARRSR